MDILSPKKIKAFKSYLPIIAQTVYAMKSVKNNALKVGCDGYFETYSRRHFI
jgi:CheY-like chemotaxis protein